MKRNETLVIYPGFSESRGFRMRIYESEVSFRHRDFFEHKHSDFEISYILSGGGIYRLRDGVCAFRAGDVFVFGTNQVHCITDTVEDEPTVLLNLQFEPRMIWSPFSNLLDEDYRKLFNGKCEKLMLESEVASFVSEKLISIRREAIERKAGYQILLRAYLCEIIGGLVRDMGFEIAEEKRDSRRESLICLDRAMTYINENLDKSLTLEEIARHAGFSRTYFSTLFASFNGLSPWEYITIRRIEQSKELLKDTDFSVLEVATRCGFSNLSNFNRKFSRITGMTPLAYRKKEKSKYSINSP